MNDSHDADAIQKEMARIRCSLNEGVEGIVGSARVMSDWRYYVRRYPWICMGAAVALGYLAVPGRLEVMRPDADALAKLAKQNRLLVKPDGEPHARGGLAGALLGLLATAATRGAVAYAGQIAERAFAERAARCSQAAGLSH